MSACNLVTWKIAVHSDPHNILGYSSGSTFHFPQTSNSCCSMGFALPPLGNCSGNKWLFCLPSGLTIRYRRMDPAEVIKSFIIQFASHFNGANDFSLRLHAHELSNGILIAYWFSHLPVRKHSNIHHPQDILLQAFRIAYDNRNHNCHSLVVRCLPWRSSVLRMDRPSQVCSIDLFHYGMPSLDLVLCIGLTFWKQQKSINEAMCEKNGKNSGFYEAFLAVV